MAFSGNRVLSKSCDHWIPSPNCCSTPITAETELDVSSAVSGGAILSEEFRKAKQKLKESSDVRHSVGDRGGLENPEDINDPIFSSLESFSEPI